MRSKPPRRDPDAVHIEVWVDEPESGLQDTPLSSDRVEQHAGLPRRGVVAALVAFVVVVGAGVALSTGSDNETSTTDAPPTSTTEPVTVAPVGVAARNTDLGWTLGRYYLGGGITLTQIPPLFGRAAEEDGSLERTSTGQLIRTSDSLTARTYLSTLRSQDGRMIAVAMRAESEVPRLVPSGDERTTVVQGQYTLVVVADGFDTNGVAQRIADGIELDESRLLDRYDVEGAFDSVVQRGGYASASSWLLVQGESSNVRDCLRLVVSDSSSPGGTHVCLEPAGDPLAFVLVGQRRFVVGFQREPDVSEQPVKTDGGGVLPVLYDGWVGPVIREVPAGVEVVSLDGNSDPACSISEVADALRLDGAAVQLADCRRKMVAVLILPMQPSDPPATLEVTRRKGDWQDPYPAPPIYIGGGLTVRGLPDDFIRTGDVLGGRFEIDQEMADGDYGITIWSSWADDARRITVRRLQSVDLSNPSAYDGPGIGSQIDGRNVTVSSPDVELDELDAVMFGLSIDPARLGDDGEEGEFGSLVAGAPAARGWTEWKLWQGPVDAGVRCYVVTEAVLGRDAPPAIGFCPMVTAESSATVVVHSANTYLFRFSRTLSGFTADAPRLTLDDGSEPTFVPVRSNAAGEAVSVAVLSPGRSLDTVLPAADGSAACQFAQMRADTPWFDLFEQAVAQIDGCELAGIPFG